MRVLVVLQQGLSTDVTQLANKLKTTVTKNSFPMDDGIAIFSCGEKLPDIGQWGPTTIVKVGECEAYPELPYNEKIESNLDWEALLIAQLETISESDVEGSDMVEDN